MNSIELTAPAKVNLFLKVLNKRKDSYHNLLTLFERISLSDRIRISKIPKGIVVTCDKPVTSRPQNNIAYKAAELILRTAKVRTGVDIRIEKRIPIGAGLGGGSSDAAAVLIGINKLFNLDIDKDKLLRLGAKLGADVPFFIFDTPFAVGRGIGSRLERLNSKTRFHHILVYPGFKVTAKDAYKALDASRLSMAQPCSPSTLNFVGGSTMFTIDPELCRPSALPRTTLSLSKGRRVEGSERLTNRQGGDKMTLPNSWNGLEGFIHNDLESVVVGKRPVIGKIIKCLVSSLGRRAMVSGSGPSVFCLYRTRKEAIGAKRKLFGSVPARARRRWQVFIAWTKM